jgi:hypothetical protein
MHTFYGKMIKLQKNFRVFKEAQNLRIQSLGKIQWEREKQVLLKACNVKKTKQKTLLWKKINLID